MKGIYHTHHLRVRGRGREERKTEKRKDQEEHRPDFTRCDAEWSGKNAHSFRFGFVWGRKGYVVGIRVKRRCAKLNVTSLVTRRRQQQPYPAWTVSP